MTTVTYDISGAANLIGVSGLLQSIAASTIFSQVTSIITTVTNTVVGERILSVLTIRHLVLLPRRWLPMQLIILVKDWPMRSMPEQQTLWPPMLVVRYDQR